MEVKKDWLSGVLKVLLCFSFVLVVGQLFLQPFHVFDGIEKQPEQEQQRQPYPQPEIPGIFLSSGQVVT